MELKHPGQWWPGELLGFGEADRSSQTRHVRQQLNAGEFANRKSAVFGTRLSCEGAGKYADWMQIRQILRETLRYETISYIA